MVCLQAAWAVLPRLRSLGGSMLSVLSHGPHPYLHPHTPYLPLISAGSMGEPGASFSEQLGEKGSRHTMLLACLAESGVYHRLIPEVQRVLFDNAEKLDVATALLALQVGPCCLVKNDGNFCL